MKIGLDRALSAADQWQRRHRVAAIAFAVNKKFGDDRANLHVVALGWYGFVAIYPLLLAVVTILSFIGAPALGHHLVSTLHRFPVVGPQFSPASTGNNLHGSVPGLIVGLAGLIYGAQGVTLTAQRAMADVWNVPDGELPGLFNRLGRSVAGLAVIGCAFVVNAVVATMATTTGSLFQVPILVALVLVNALLYLTSFRLLTPSARSLGDLAPGAALSGLGFTALITLGAGFVQHQVRHSSSTYGQFSVVIGLVAFLFLLAKVTMYGAELNPVLRRGLWPRALPRSTTTGADERAVRYLTHQRQYRTDGRIPEAGPPHRGIGVDATRATVAAGIGTRDHGSGG